MVSKVLQPCERIQLTSLPPPAALRDRDERLQALKGLVAHLAHDFNNSLVPLMGYATLLKEDLGGSGSPYLAKLEGCARRSQDLMESLLLATHPERHFSPRQVDFPDLLQRTIEAWLKALPASAQISLETSLAPCVLWIDEGQWSKVIQHLLRNAQGALAEGGRLEITLRPCTLTASQAADLGMSETQVFELSFEDSGCGMPEDVLKRACDPLFTTRPGSPTAGLGLTLVHSVVRLHGGQMDVESAEDAGTVVRIWLPVGGV